MFSLEVRIRVNKDSTANIKSKGVKGHYCLMPLNRGKGEERMPLTDMVEKYNALSIEINAPPK